MPQSAYQVVCTDIIESDRPLQVVSGRAAAIDLMIEKAQIGMSTMAFGVEDPPVRRKRSLRRAAVVARRHARQTWRAALFLAAAGFAAAGVLAAFAPVGR